MWQAAIAVGSAIIGGISSSRQQKAQKKAAQAQINANYEAANRNIKDLEREITKKGQTQQGERVARRVAAAEAASAAEIGSGVEGQSIELYNQKITRDLESDLGRSDFQFETFTQDMARSIEEVAYNTNQQNEAISKGASGGSSALNALSTGLNIASAYQSGLNQQTQIAQQEAQIEQGYTNNQIPLIDE